MCTMCTMCSGGGARVRAAGARACVGRSVRLHAQQRACARLAEQEGHVGDGCAHVRAERGHAATATTAATAATVRGPQLDAPLGWPWAGSRSPWWWRSVCHRHQQHRRGAQLARSSSRAGRARPWQPAGQRAWHQRELNGHEARGARRLHVHKHAHVGVGAPVRRCVGGCGRGRGRAEVERGAQPAAAAQVGASVEREVRPSLQRHPLALGAGAALGRARTRARPGAPPRAAAVAPSASSSAPTTAIAIAIAMCAATILGLGLSLSRVHTGPGARSRARWRARGIRR
mmetsp:Transcript_1160/g.3028  ORF Transcript_1160/g.3028 Transcript_1160/m.3028 type:complete len:287 (-) Transcript_1160:255-1115(-)